MDYHKEFPVGSVVYFLHKERVLPAQIFEKIVRTSMEGSKSTYLMKVRSKKPEGFSVLELDPETSDVFQTPDEMKAFMIARATEAIKELVDAAVQSSASFENVVAPEDLQPDVEDYESWHVPAAERPIKGSEKKKNQKEKKEEYAEVDLGDGRKARLKM